MFQKLNYYTTNTSESPELLSHQSTLKWKVDGAIKIGNYLVIRQAFPSFQPAFFLSYLFITPVQRHRSSSARVHCHFCAFKYLRYLYARKTDRGSEGIK